MDKRALKWVPMWSLVLILLVGQSGDASAQGIGLAQLMRITDWGSGSLVLFDQLEYAPGAEGGPVTADVIAWYGGAFSRVWVEADLEQLTEESEGEGDLTVSYGRLVTPYFDALVGGRLESRWGAERATRVQLSFGLQGMAPFRFELSPAVHVTPRGEISGDVTAEYQFLITQRLVASPELRLTAALQEVPEWGVGSGLNSVETGIRLRYEFIREFAPYLGVEWSRLFGATAQLRSLEGETGGDVQVVAGMRFWI